MPSGKGPSSLGTIAMRCAVLPTFLYRGRNPTQQHSSNTLISAYLVYPPGIPDHTSSFH